MPDRPMVRISRILRETGKAASSLMVAAPRRWLCNGRQQSPPPVIGAYADEVPGGVQSTYFQRV